MLLLHQSLQLLYYLSAVPVECRVRFFPLSLFLPVRVIFRRHSNGLYLSLVFLSDSCAPIPIRALMLFVFSIQSFLPVLSVFVFDLTRKSNFLSTECLHRDRVQESSPL